MINREKTRKIIVLLGITLVLFLIAAGMRHIWLMVICLPLMAYDYYMIHKVNRCPYCGEEIRGLHWNAPSLGECPACGREVFYDDVDLSDETGITENKSDEN